MHTAALMGLLAMLASASPAAPMGWLGDGSGHFGSSEVPRGWTADAPGGWSVKMPAWSNASPVVVGDQICMTAEPLSVFCVSASTGKTRWSREITYLDTVPSKERARVNKERQEALDLAKALQQKERALNKLKRAMRKARGSADAAERSKALLAEIGPLKERLDGLAHLRPPEPIDLMGTAPSTPVSDGQGLFVLMGNGVAARLSLSGSLIWARSLGQPNQRMRGFNKGQTASPLLVGGVLIVALNHLHGLDPATGKILWSRPEPYLDYGAPRMMGVEGVPLVVTPKGEVIRVSDGALLVSELGTDVYFVGPLTQGRRIFFVGATTDPDLQERTAVAIDLKGPVGSLKAVEAWRRSLSKEKTYATPLLHKGLIYTLGIRGSLVVLEADSGQVVYEEALDLGRLDVMPSPVAAGDEVVLMGGTGQVIVIKAGRRYEPLYSARLGDVRATPALHAGRMIVRGLERLWSLSSP